MTRVKLAFVLDCTASMGPWIHAAKTKIHEIIENSIKDHNQATFEVGLVAYRDHGDDRPIQVIGFTTPENVMMSMRDMAAEGGDDVPESVAEGYLHLMREMDWANADVRLVFHIADAPAHGLK